MISLVTVTQGNPVALRRTIDNVREAFGGLLNEIVVGDVSVFDDNFTTGFDDVRFVKLPFNALFKHGFASVLNNLASRATNDLCLYLNVGEIVEKNLDTALIRPEFNCYSFNHAVDPHIWVRMWDRCELSWSGRIHECIVGPKRQCPTILFQMADLPKDEEDEFAYSAYLDCKEILYFHLYRTLWENPDDIGATDRGWLDYAVRERDDLQRRLDAKGDRLKAFETGDIELLRTALKRDMLPKEWSKP